LVSYALACFNLLSGLLKSSIKRANQPLRSTPNNNYFFPKKRKKKERRKKGYAFHSASEVAAVKVF